MFFLVEEAFDNVWDEMILYKLKTYVPQQIYLILKSCLTEKFFQAKINQSVSKYGLVKMEFLKGASWDHFYTYLHHR